MPLETGDFISDLVETNPPGTDNVSQGDDHVRLIKHVLKTTFPNIDGAVTATDEELNSAGKSLMPIVTTYSTPITAATHTFTVGRSWYRVYVTGGGGGGGTEVNTFSCPGAAGGTAIKCAEIQGASATYTLGAGGAIGSDGETSSFVDGTTDISATGGEAGAGTAALANPAGGIGVNGDTNIQGGGGGAAGHPGSASYWGGGETAVIPAPRTTPLIAFGVGGNGAGGTASGTSLASAGQNGVIVIEEY